MSADLSTNPVSVARQQESAIHSLSSQRWLLGAGMALSVLTVLIGYFIGHRQGVTEVGASAEEVTQLRKELDKKTQLLATLTKTVESSVQERDIALSTNNGLQANLAMQTALVDQTTAERNFYQDKILAQGGFPLEVQQLTIKPLPENAFEYHLDLAQLRKNRTAVNGSYTLKLIEGQTVLSIPVSPSRFSLTDFSHLKGRWTMPTGFNPQFIEVSVQAAGDPVTQRYAWESTAETIELPATLDEMPPLQTLPSRGTDHPSATPPAHPVAPVSAPSVIAAESTLKASERVSEKARANVKEAARPAPKSSSPLTPAKTSPAKTSASTQGASVKRDDSAKERNSQAYPKTAPKTAPINSNKAAPQGLSSLSDKAAVSKSSNSPAAGQKSALDKASSIKHDVAHTDVTAKASVKLPAGSAETPQPSVADPF